MNTLLLRFEAPLMSFGGPMVDGRGPTERVPARSMLAGLLANALGLHHRDYAQTQALQARLDFAVRCDLAGEVLEDYQTADLGQDHLLDDRAWTTWGHRVERGGSGANKTGTHIRRRQYLADACYTLAIQLLPPAANDVDPPDIARLANALRAPFRPLFLGRGSCIPAAPLLLDIIAEDDLEAALRAAPLPARLAHSRRLEQREWVFDAWLPATADDLSTLSPFVQRVSDERDWLNQIHVGERYWRRIRLQMNPGMHP
jgi:CRISPR system Cascade subunit CasD